MGTRAIIHSDVNCYYAQAECQRHPVLRAHPVAVAGKEELRHGIVLTKNRIAKAWGVKTGEALWEARRKCPALVVVPPDYRMYSRVSRAIRRIYYSYTDQVEPFGLDEAWLDVTGSLGLFRKTPEQLAHEIKGRIYREIGLTVSMGVSWNKIFAKFGSDAADPDSIVAITPGDYREKVWPAPVRDLLYVGAATERKLLGCNVKTIGDVANAPDSLLHGLLGKMGLVLKAFARGLDASPVKVMDPADMDVPREVKSVGNGITYHKDIDNPGTAKSVVWALAESVAQRMRRLRVRCRTVAVSWRDAETLAGCVRQAPCPLPTNITGEVARIAYGRLMEEQLFERGLAIRSVNVRGANLVPAEDLQLSLFDPLPRRTERERLDEAVDGLRSMFGAGCVVWGPRTMEEGSWALNAATDEIHQIHPVSYFHD